MWGQAPKETTEFLTKTRSLPCTPLPSHGHSGLMKHQSKQKQVKKALAATKKNPGMVKAAKEKQCAIQCPICRVRLS